MATCFCKVASYVWCVIGRSISVSVRWRGFLLLLCAASTLLAYHGACALTARA